ncbi:ABC transporter ATP-binding protein [Thiohalocapsa marina]|uniref:ABC transporter ATP-binding protein n=1 Tax=Thiohalocapsa marina TaxID=424902 RepID=A0A5M8FRV5_9GAMM|nr:ABC transporter ATP-binding protein [Thiohalocapsa marina]KAA6185815.1 ABC transporter ATP-binding protein [Thiohalocapsa marina]
MNLNPDQARPDPSRSDRPRPELLRLDAASFGYGTSDILRQVDFALRPGDRVALVGPNGAGKTTLLHLLVGLCRPSQGRVIAFGRERRTEADFLAVRARVGLLFQHSDDQLFCPTVLDDVAFGPLNLGQSPSMARQTAERTLRQLGLADYAERVTHRLSAGEKRLVALATVLAMKPEVLLLDEPTTGLDEASEARLIGYLSGLEQAMLIVSHDRRFLERLANRAVVLRGGRLSEAQLHRHPHTHHHTHLHLHLPGADGADDLAHGQDGGAAPAHGDHHDGESSPG